MKQAPSHLGASGERGSCKRRQADEAGMIANIRHKIASSNDKVYYSLHNIKTHGFESLIIEYAQSIQLFSMNCK